MRGFKTFRRLEKFKPAPINILIGANGAGKSNFISFFRLLSWMIGAGRLQEYVAMQGGASALLHDGPETTREIEATATFETAKGRNDYSFRLFYAAGDTLVFASEGYRFSRFDIRTEATWTTLAAGHKEAKIIERGRSKDPNMRTAGVVLSLLKRIVLYQFHNTAEAAPIRTKSGVNDCRRLREHGGNIAAILLKLREREPVHYERIVERIRLVAPFFEDFVLEPEYNKVLLQWKEKSCDVTFDASQASDGMLRLFCLITLLCQPLKDIPDILILDEPELGLHPTAINLASDLIRSVSKNKQVIIATQSAPFVNNFEPEEVIVVDRADRESTLKRLNSRDLKDWLEDYTLGDLWQKNILGGKP
ncbi:MAG TPA: AAA family ATPase [Sedimentisphaerales bacterium]|nr:AAA family ATPase [Sedimentisphaerales bacterium]